MGREGECYREKWKHDYLTLNNIRPSIREVTVISVMHIVCMNVKAYNGQIIIIHGMVAYSTGTQALFFHTLKLPGQFFLPSEK